MWCSAWAAANGPLRWKNVWHHNGRPVFKFFGIDSISEAQVWRGADVLAPGDRAGAARAEGEYSYADLIGCGMHGAPADECRWEWFGELRSMAAGRFCG